MTKFGNEVSDFLNSPILDPKKIKKKISPEAENLLKNIYELQKLNKWPKKDKINKQGQVVYVYDAKTTAKTLKDNNISCPVLDVLVEISSSGELDKYMSRHPRGWAEQVIDKYNRYTLYSEPDPFIRDMLGYC